MQRKVPNIRLVGPARYRLRCLRMFSEAVARVSLRRSVKGPRLGWNWYVEVVTSFLKHQLCYAFDLEDVVEARKFLDTVRIESPATRKVTMSRVEEGAVRGAWFVPKNSAPQATMLYLHGGGYSFHPVAYEGFVSEITVAANTRTFALDYRLAPEFPFPAQREDAVRAYRWLLAQGVDPEEIVVAGDSAGGNLTLSLLLAVRQERLPMPALAVCMSPATEFMDASRPSIWNNAQYDWIDPRMLFHWSSWFCKSEEKDCADVSPIKADLRGLPPIYIQAGQAEILYDCIVAFVREAERQGADIEFEPWKNMTHVFQMFGNEAPQSVAALKRIGEVIERRLQTQSARTGT